MLTELISDFFEAAALRGLTRAFKRMGLSGKPDPDEAYAEFAETFGVQTPAVAVIETTATATETKKKTK